MLAVAVLLRVLPMVGFRVVMTIDGECEGPGVPVDDGLDHLTSSQSCSHVVLDIETLLIRLVGVGYKKNLGET